MRGLQRVKGSPDVGTHVAVELCCGCGCSSGAAAMGLLCHRLPLKPVLGRRWAMPEGCPEVNVLLLGHKHVAHGGL